MKRFLPLLLSLFMLTSCAAHTPKRKIEEKDVKRMIYEAVEEERLILLDQEEIGFVLDIEPEDYSSAWVWQDRTAATIDEIGIFIAKTGMENALYQQIEGYLTACKNDKKEWVLRIPARHDGVYVQLHRSNELFRLSELDGRGRTFHN